MFCRERVAQLRDRYEDFRARNAEVVAIGMGRPDMAADFRERQEIPFPLLVDHTKETYRAVEMGRGSLWDILGPPVWLRGLKNLVTGKQGPIRQDPYQLGGAVVVDVGGEVRFVHRSASSADNVPIDDLLAALS